MLWGTYQTTNADDTSLKRLLSVDVSLLLSGSKFGRFWARQNLIFWVRINWSKVQIIKSGVNISPSNWMPATITSTSKCPGFCQAPAPVSSFLLMQIIRTVVMASVTEFLPHESRIEFLLPDFSPVEGIEGENQLLAGLSVSLTPYLCLSS